MHIRSGRAAPLWLAAIYCVALVLGASSAAGAQTVGATAMTDNPCPPQQHNAGADAFAQAMVTPGAPFAPPPAPTEQDRINAAIRRADDWAGRCRYHLANAALTQAPDIVFIGDSITELWAAADPSFFGSAILNRGIGGQTSGQILARYYADVIRLRPRVVHILAGTNDIAGNTGPSSAEDFQNNIMAMVELARAHGIKVVIGAIPPADGFWWAPQHQPTEQMQTLNAWLRAYAAESGAAYADYFTGLANAGGGLPSSYANDGVHPNRDGYAVMRRIATDALRSAN